MEAVEERTEPTVAHASSDIASPRPRSRWSISLGGVLLFAAGAMVGFAPMRAWLFFRDDPEQVVIEAILFDVHETENEKVREAFAAGEGTDLDRGIDPLAILASRTRTHRVLSQPTLTTIVDETLTLSFGASVSPVAQPDGSIVYLPTDGVHISFQPTVRPSGKLHLRFESTYYSSPSANVASGEGREVSVESAVVVDADEWRLVELNLPTEEDIAAKRTRWFLLRMKPASP